MSGQSKRGQLSHATPTSTRKTPTRHYSLFNSDTMYSKLSTEDRSVHINRTFGTVFFFSSNWRSRSTPFRGRLNDKPRAMNPPSSCTAGHNDCYHHKTLSMSCFAFHMYLLSPLANGLSECSSQTRSAPTFVSYDTSINSTFKPKRLSRSGTRMWQIYLVHAVESCLLVFAYFSYVLSLSCTP